MLFINPAEDLFYVLKYINDYSKEIGLKAVEIEHRKLAELIAGAKEDGHYAVGGASCASVFRKLASFITYFVAVKPIVRPFPKGLIGDDLSRINNHQNAIMALQIARCSLLGAKIYHRDDQVVIVANPVKLSKHSYVDIVEALALTTPNDGMNLVAVLLEQMTYRQNPDCEYKP